MVRTGTLPVPGDRWVSGGAPTSLCLPALWQSCCLGGGGLPQERRFAKSVI
ncbi:MAG: hypothetical protein MUC60_17750 [Oscillatoria sp. Prado101]|nr:hypothetical protein [Oscillatoria sp. Prado101]